MQLTTVWFILITVLWTGYFVLEGFDFGVGMLFPVLGRGKKEVVTTTADGVSKTTDGELKRRVLLNTIGPVWDGNEVWVLTAGGATFAAFPSWYATMFSGLYLPLLLILVALIVRALAFDYRGKRDSIAWRRGWDAAIVFGSFVPALLWGVALTNVVRGLPINAQHEYVGNFFTLLNPVSLLGGVTVVALFLTHGALFIALKTEGDIRLEARTLALQVGVAAAALAVAFLVLVNSSSGSAASWAVAGVAALALVGGLVFAWRGREGWAFTGTFVAIGAAVCCLFLALFPDVMPSSLNPAWSLTAENAASGSYTLKIMTGVALLFTPLVVLYEGWTYWVFRRRIGTQHIPVAAH